MTAEEHFPVDYRAGRAAFLSAAADRGLSTVTRVHPTAVGREGRPLFLDTVSLGRRDARTALLLIAGTHGVEGYFGSAVLTGLLRENALAVPPDVKVVLLHALNPYGFAWDRRVDEANVDVNRNFVDFANAPANPDYDALAGHLGLADLSPDAEAAADAALQADAARMGMDVLHRAITLGQYLHPGGLLYGGTGPGWSQTMLFDILKEELRLAERLTVIDLHTGLGTSGAAEIISDDPTDSWAFRRAKAIWGEVTTTLGGDSVSPPTRGALGPAVERVRPGSVAVTLEVGTAPLMEIFRVLRRDNWLHQVAGRDRPEGAAVAAEMRTVFAPETALWKRRVWAAARCAVADALAALA